MNKLAAIVGPTAVGKTKISLGVANKLNAEIISCDSMQVYKGMDIGTAKAAPAEQAEVKHHMLDICAPQENFSVADYQKEVKLLIAELNRQAKVPLLVGGTGLYYQSVVDNYDFFPLEALNMAREKWQAIYEDKGIEYIYGQLLKIDPQYALTIGENDKKRTIRALEVFELTGKPFSSLQKKQKDTYKLAVVGLTMNRPALYKRIEIRVDEMLQQGLIEEVMELRKEGATLEHTSMQAIGYKQVFYYLDGMLSKAELINEIKRETRHFAKRQYTWFRKDKRIFWLDADEYSEQEAIEKIAAFIESKLFV